MRCARRVLSTTQWDSLPQVENSSGVRTVSAKARKTRAIRFPGLLQVRQNIGLPVTAPGVEMCRGQAETRTAAHRSRKSIPIPGKTGVGHANSDPVPPSRFPQRIGLRVPGQLRPSDVAFKTAAWLFRRKSMAIPFPDNLHPDATSGNDRSAALLVRHAAVW